MFVQSFTCKKKDCRIVLPEAHFCNYWANERIIVHTYKWVMARTCECVTAHIWMSRGTSICESFVCVWHDTCTKHTCTCVFYDSFICACWNSFVCVLWLVHTCVMTNSYVCVLTDLHVCHHSSICVWYSSPYVCDILLSYVFAGTHLRKIVKSTIYQILTLCCGLFVLYAITH